MQFPSKLIEDAVNEIAKLPGIGKKTALRLALFLLKEEPETTEKLADALVKLRTQVKYCQECFNLSDDDVCSVCADRTRDRSTVCVVESTTDVMAIENTGQYRGLYHVLGGVISPIDGVGPEQLKIKSLLEKVGQGKIAEVILALNATMEADTTAFYITSKLKDLPLKVTAIARGVPVGSELEYTDEVTLGRSITRRVAYE
jgi:recombination protein RecR